MDEIYESRLLRKVTWRLIPFMFICYIVCFLDRVNVGFAALQMKRDLGFSDVVFGFGSGVFFIGYFVFEIPSNLILERVGARLWIARIMITWGLISSAMMWVRGEYSFYTLRFLLGLAEAGFFPGMILYLTYWYPSHARARMVALFMTGIPVANIIGGPVSGVLLRLDQVAEQIGWDWLISLVAHLKGWQWMFLIEGLPAVILGGIVLFYLPDGPHQARWLSPDERNRLAARLAEERKQKEARRHFTLLQACANGRVWLLCLLYFTLMINLYGLGIWLPQIIQRFSGLREIWVGILTAIPYLVAAIGMVLWGRHSDATGERRWHVTLPALLAATGFVAAAYLRSPALALAALSLGALGILGALGPFWAMPTAFLTGTAAAGGIALINSIGNLGGFTGPYVMGWLKQLTDAYRMGLLFLAATLLVAGTLAQLVGHDRQIERPVKG
ncbi:MAG: MFS transporter [Candidatus Sumerlaeia bacterium]|nr:MFS transporter [Candidatus Sumerlaeia bacterium]